MDACPWSLGCVRLKSHPACLPAASLFLACGGPKRGSRKQKFAASARQTAAFRFSEHVPPRGTAVAENHRTSLCPLRFSAVFLKAWGMEWTPAALRVANFMRQHKYLPPELKYVVYLAYSHVYLRDTGAVYPALGRLKRLYRRMSLFCVSLSGYLFFFRSCRTGL